MTAGAHRARFITEKLDAFLAELTVELDRLRDTPVAELLTRGLVDEVLERARTAIVKALDRDTGVMTLALDPGDRELRFLAALRTWNAGGDFVFEDHVIENRSRRASERQRILAEAAIPGIVAERDALRAIAKAAREAVFRKCGDVYADAEDFAAHSQSDWAAHEELRVALAAYDAEYAEPANLPVAEPDDV